MIPPHGAERRRQVLRLCGARDRARRQVGQPRLRKRAAQGAVETSGSSAAEAQVSGALDVLEQERAKRRDAVLVR